MPEDEKMEPAEEKEAEQATAEEKEAEQAAAEDDDADSDEPSTGPMEVDREPMHRAPMDEPPPRG